MAAFKLESELTPKGDQAQAIDELVVAINENKKHNVLLGITGSGKTFSMANVINQVKRPTLILSHNKTLAAQLYSEFKSLFPENMVEFFISYYDYYQPEAYLPITDTFIEKDSSINEEIDKMRLRATASLATRRDIIIISSVSCIYGIGSPENYNNAYISINKSKKLDLKEIMKELVEIHYIRNDAVLEPGTFRLLGENFEIFPIYDDYPIRIELFNDKIEYMSTFDPLNGLQIKEKDNIIIYPAKHFITDKDTIKRAHNDIRSELAKQINYFKKENKLLEAQRIEQRTLYDLEMMMELGYCSGIENYSRHLDGRKKGEKPFTLLDFFPKDYLLFIDESHASIPQLRAMYNGDKSRKKTLVEHGFRLPSALDNRPLQFNEFQNTVNQCIYVSATPSDYEIEKAKGIVIEQLIRPTGLIDPLIETHKTKGQIDNLISEINIALDREERVLITTLTKRMAEELSDYLKKFGINVEYLHSEIDTIERVKIINLLRKGIFDVLVGVNLLREGLDIPEVSLVAVLDADKEGFLRSKTSLIQVAGRAARNINGKVILYGDRITNSMKHLIDETDRRREIQIKYNKINNITPQSIIKSIKKEDLFHQNKDKKTIQKFNQSEFELNFDNIEEVELIKKLKKEMLKASKDLQFEKAGFLRDKIQEIEKNDNFIV